MREIKTPKLSIERLREVLAYDPQTGIFRWRRDVGNRRSGTVAGNTNTTGHIRICIDGESLMAHRLAVFYMTGAFPKSITDHRNLDGTDNRWSNIRPADKSQNGANRGKPCTNTSGHKGVRWYARYRKWHAQIKANGKRLHLGHHESLTSALAAYEAAAIRHFGEYARVA